MENPRQPVLDALASLPDYAWGLVLSAMEGINTTVGMTIADNPAPESRLASAIDAELRRLKAR